MAVRFDASTDSYQATANLPTGTAYSAVCWAYISVDRNDFSGIFSLNELLVTTDADGTTIKLWDTGSYSGGQFVGFAMTAGAWHRIGLVCNGANVSMYFGAADGALSVRTVSNFTTPSSPTQLIIGSDFYNEWWNGRVAAFKLWGAALTAVEIEIELSQYQPMRTLNLNRDYPFWRAENVDYSGNAFNLSTATGAVTEDGPPIPISYQLPQLIVGAGAGQTVDAGTVAMQAVAGLSADGYQQRFGGVNLTASTNLAVAGDNTTFATAALTAVASLSANAISALVAQATMSAIASLTSAGIRTSQASVILDAVAELTAEGTEEAISSAMLTAVANLNASSGNTTFAIADLIIAADLAIDTLSTVFAAVDMVSIANLDTDVDVARLAQTDIVAVAELLIDEVSANRPSSVVMQSVAELLVSAYAQQLATVTLTASSTLSALSGNISDPGVVDLIAIPSVSVAVDRTAVAQVLMDNATELLAGVQTEGFALSLMDVVAQLEVAAGGSQVASALMTAITDVQVVGLEELFTSALLNSIASLNVTEPDRTTGGLVDLEVVTDVASTIDAERHAAATLAATTTLLVEGLRDVPTGPQIQATTLLVADALTSSTLSAFLQSHASLDVNVLGDRVSAADMVSVVDLIASLTRTTSSDVTLQSIASLSANGGGEQLATVLLDVITSLNASGTPVVGAAMQADIAASLAVDSFAEKAIAASLTVETIMLIDSTVARLAAINLITEASLVAGAMTSGSGVVEIVAIAELIATVAEAIVHLPLSVQGPVLNKLLRGPVEYSSPLTVITNPGYQSQIGTRGL